MHWQQNGTRVKKDTEEEKLESLCLVTLKRAGVRMDTLSSIQ